MSKTPAPSFHGSDLEQISAYYHIPREAIVNFGANVNPLGLSKKVKRALAENLDVITRYPDREYKSLRQVIANYCQVDFEHIVVGNGSTELISLLIQHRNARHALVIGPTYSEYRRELSLTNSRLSFYHLREADHFKLDLEDFMKTLTDDIDLFILCNPNNPTSSVLSLKELELLIAECKRRGIFLMIDETYVEFTPCMSEVTAMPLVRSYDSFIIIRGISKFFAAPGLRLGYGVTSNPDFLSTLKLYQNPWSLNSVASFAGELMLNDTDYIKKTRELISSERKKICRCLDHFRYARYYTPFANFILIRILKEGLSSRQVFEHAIRQGLMIRDCSSFENLKGEYIRFCIMNPEDNTKLLTCLGELLS